MGLAQRLRARLLLSASGCGVIGRARKGARPAPRHNRIRAVSHGDRIGWPRQANI